MATLPKVGEELAAILETFRSQRDNEVSILAEVLSQYVQDHRDTAAYRDIDRQVNAFACGLDKMIGRLAKWQAEAEKIEGAVENFYGD